MTHVFENFSISRFLGLGIAALSALVLSACGGGSGTVVGPTTGIALFTSAPAAVTIVSGSVSYNIGGGTPIYTVTSSNPNVATANISGNGMVLNINAVATGTSQVVVRDAIGASVTISVTIGSGGTTTALFTTAPASVTLKAGTAAIYTIGGGTPPYMVSSSAPSQVTGSASGTTLTIDAIGCGATCDATQIVVLDSAGAKVSFLVSVSSGQATTPLFTSAPNSITILAGATPTYSISGGTSPYTAASNNASVATSTVGGTTLAISGVAPGTAQIVLRDAVGATVTISVTVGSDTTATALFTTAPSSITLGLGTTVAYTVSGGTPAYAASSSNLAVAIVEISGNGFTVTGVAPGIAQVVVFDSTGASRAITVTVGSGGTATSLFATSPSAIVLAIGETGSYEVKGGTPPYTATSSNTSIATTGIADSALNITGANAGDAQIIIFDASGASVLIAVTVGP